MPSSIGRPLSDPTPLVWQDRQFRVSRPPHARGGLRVASAQQIHGPHQHRTTRRFRPANHLLGALPVDGHIELIPERAAERPGDVLHRRRRNRRQNLRGLLGLGRPRDRHFALGVEHLLPADRAEEDGRFPGNAEHFRPQIGFGHVHQPPRRGAGSAETLAIELQRGIVIHAAHQVAQMRGRQHAASESLEIAHTQGVGRAGNGRGILLRPGIVQQGAAASGTGREKSQKIAAFRGVSGMASPPILSKKPQQAGIHKSV